MRHSRSNGTAALPIDLERQKFGKDNSWIIIGLPNNEEQYIDSLKRNGVALQFSWNDYFDTVVFTNESFPQNHPLNGARVAESVDEGGLVRGDLYPCYQLRRRQIENLIGLGLNVVFGATGSDFLEAADRAFSCGGLLSVLAHFEMERGFEFADGFLSIADICKLRSPTGSGVLDAAACDTGLVARPIKRALGSSTWVYLPTAPLSLSGALLHRSEFWTSIVDEPKTLVEHLKWTSRRLREAGVPTGSGDRSTNGAGGADIDKSTDGT